MPDRDASDIPPAVAALVERLRLAPHPEGGWYRETHRAALQVAHEGIDGGPRRAAATAIYFLLPARAHSAWHRVRASDETWHWYAGDPLELFVLSDAGVLDSRLLTANLARGEPQCTIPAGCWQAARPVSCQGTVAAAGFVLCGCTVAPGFDFADFEMPPASELAARFPAHADILRELGRSP